MQTKKVGRPSKLSKLEELKRVVEFAKEQKLQYVKLGDIEVQLSPQALITPVVQEPETKTKKKKKEEPVDMWEDPLMYMSS